MHCTLRHKVNKSNHNNNNHHNNNSDNSHDAAIKCNMSDLGGFRFGLLLKRQICQYVDFRFRKQEIAYLRKRKSFMVEVISGPNVLWQLYRPPGITRAFRQKGHREHKTLGHTGHRGHFTDWVRKDLGRMLSVAHIWDFSRSKLSFSLTMKRRVGGIFAHVWGFGLKIKIEVLSDNEEMLSVEVLRPFCATAATAMAPPPVHRMFNFFNTVQYWSPNTMQYRNTPDGKVWTIQNILCTTGHCDGLTNKGTENLIRDRVDIEITIWCQYAKSLLIALEHC